MISFAPTRDEELIKAVVTHRRIYPHISDDFTDDPSLWEMPENENITYLCAYDGEELLGMWVLIPENTICWDVHTCLLPSAWGSRAIQAAKAAIDWVWKNTACVRLTTHVPEYNVLALRFAESAGMTKFGFNDASYQKKGKLWGQHLLGISKGLVN